MKKIILLSTLINLLIFGNPCWISAQGVGVSGNGAIPDPSALLDVDATSMTPKKGLLIPRVALTSVTDKATILTPATSLLVYNTGFGALAPAGYYYNMGTTGAANWIPFLTSDVNAPAAWSLKGNTGTTASTATIGSTVNNHFIGTTDLKDFVFASNNLERMRITSTGNTGIGTNNPVAKLDVVGEVKFGNTSSTCNSTNEGQQRYNTATHLMEYCNGTAWSSMGGSVAGTYTGDGTASKSINVGFRPKAVIVKCINGVWDGQMISIDGILSTDVHLRSFADNVTGNGNVHYANELTITATGFDVGPCANDSGFNFLNSVYYYVAIR